MKWFIGGISYSDGTMDTELMLAIATVVAYLATSFYAVYLGQPWHPNEFGQGVGFMFAGMAAILKFRKTD